MRFLMLAAILMAPLLLAASESLIVWNPLAYQLSTMTIKALEPTATTLENVCTPSASPPSKAPNVRNVVIGISASTWKVAGCMPLELTQGPSTWEYKNTNSWGKVHATCSFSGGPLPQGTGVCTYSGSGPITQVAGSTQSWSGAMSAIADYDTVSIVTPATLTPAIPVTDTPTQTPVSYTSVNSAHAGASAPTASLDTRVTLLAIAGSLGTLLLAIGL